jgi:GT2 family glycosyltransferase
MQIKLPTISIIFPIYNGGNEPLECLKSIHKLNYPRSKLEIIVIDNASTDGSPALINKYYPHVILIRLKQNFGFAKAVNLGIKKSHGEYLFITNDDVLFDKNSMSLLIKYILLHPEAGCLTGKILSKKLPKQIASGGCMFNHFTGNINLKYQSNIVHHPDWAQGCAMFIPKSIFKQTGLFDTGFPHFFEDQDLCLRIKKQGYLITYLPNILFWHGESTTANKNLKDKYFRWYCGKIRFILKNLPVINIFAILIIQFILVMPVRTIILRDGRFFPFLNALGWNIITLNKTLAARYNKNL